MSRWGIHKGWPTQACRFPWAGMQSLDRTRSKCEAQTRAHTHASTYVHTKPRCSQRDTTHTHRNHRSQHCSRTVLPWPHKFQRCDLLYGSHVFEKPVRATFLCLLVNCDTQIYLDFGIVCAPLIVSFDFITLGSWCALACARFGATPAPYSPVISGMHCYQARGRHHLYQRPRCAAWVTHRVPWHFCSCPFRRFLRCSDKPPARVRTSLKTRKRITFYFWWCTLVTVRFRDMTHSCVWHD